MEVVVRPICGEAIPASVYSCSVFVGFKHPVISRQVSLRAVSSLRTCADLVQIGQAYSTLEKHSTIAELRRTSVLTPPLEVIDFREILFLTDTFLLVFSIGSRFRQRSRVPHK